MANVLSDALKGLHALLRRLADLEAELAHVPKLAAQADKQVVAGEQQIEHQKAAIKAAKKSADEQNLKLRSKEADLGKLQGQLNTAASNKEFDIIKGQLASAQSEKGRLEDAALEAMDAIDAANKKLKELEADLLTRRQAAKTAKTAAESQLPVLQSRIAELNTEIAEAEKSVPAGDLLSTYRRLRTAHGAGALSPLEDDFCSSCNHRVTAQDMVRIRLAEFVACRGCGRILYAD